MMNSLFAGVSGLRNHLTEMDVIGNNIANINTIGFKAGRTTFKEMLVQTIKGASRQTATVGGVNPLQYGLGMAVGSIDNIFSQGGLEMTGKATDLAIQGSGFFILSDGVSNYYTRAGNFSFDAVGNLIDPGTGYILQGKMADDNGEIPPGTAITNIQLPLGQTAPAKATTKIEYSGNLDANAGTVAVVTGDTLDFSSPITITEDRNDDVKIKVEGADGSSVEEEITLTAGEYEDLDSLVAEINAQISSSDLAGKVQAVASDDAIQFQTIEGGSEVKLTLSDGTHSALTTLGFTSGASDSGTGDSSTAYSTSMKVYDSLGGTHTLTLSFTKTGENTWSWIASVTGAEAGTVKGSSGTVTFKDNGSIDNFQYDNGATSFSFTPDNGAKALSITLNAGSKFNGLTQFQSPSTAIAKSQDGYGMGTLDSISIDSSGVISGIFTNGVTRNLAQIVLADFNNPAGLLKVGDNMYQESANSGQPVKGIARSTISGSISSGYLEMSNVDLARELTNMIIAQRGFQANARTITTTDNMLSELVNLKR